MKKITVLLGLLIAFNAQHVVAQCLTDQVSDQYHANHPEHADEIEKMEEQITHWKESRDQNVRRANYIIPVVFHVIHSSGVENISKEQILDQIRVMNEDFQMLNADKGNLRTYFKNKNIAANLGVEFRLAKIDDQGNCTDGINRVYSNLTFNSGEAVKSLPGVQWDYKKYLNIYVVNNLAQDPSQQGTLLGYARFPWQTNQFTDGILIRSDRVGTIGTAVGSGAGRTMTHEVGHWLGLMHPFQGGCSTNNNSTDRVDDTPPVGSTFANSDCPANGNSCSNDVPNEIDLWENYMDYSRGTCQVMFTKGQKTRTDFFLTSGSYTRRLNVSQSNLEATGVVAANDKPVASFTSDTRVVCAGNPVAYYDASCKGMVANRLWTFDGADISSTNAEKPVVTYNTPGLYKVILTVSNTNGSSTSTVDQYIEVRPNNGTFIGYVQVDFEKPIGDIPEFFPSDIGTGDFKISSNAGLESSSSLFAGISSSTPKGTKFVYESKDLNAKYLRGLPKYLTFSTSWAPDINGEEEELKVLVSTDCGANWQQRFYRFGGGLTRVTATNSSFVPSSDADWRLHFVNLSSSLQDNDSNYRIRIEVTAFGGNSVYLDNINISQFLSNNIELQKDATKMYPNPATSLLNLEMAPGVRKVEVLNMMGQTVISQSFNSSNNSVIKHQLDINTLENGVYMVRFITDNNTFAQKLVVNR
ncbi:M43 family zinc metalloprotease [Bacteroidia bacterium]|nr:M43 family zinc metalloprotease [Bacteroidia bacterium]